MKSKIPRHRRVRKHLKFYKEHFHFTTPYQIMMDGDFCHESLTCKINVQEQVPKYLDDESSTLCTTSCVVSETMMLGKKGHDILNILKECKIQECGHKDAPVPSAECLFSVVKRSNPDHFFIATQNQDLIDKCRSIACIPLLYVRYNAVSLESPTVESKEIVQMKRKASPETAKTPQKKKKFKSSFSHKNAKTGRQVEKGKKQRDQKEKTPKFVEKKNKFV